MANESEFHTTLTRTIDFKLNIKEDDGYAIILTLLRSNSIQETLTIENANTNMRLIQKEKFCSSCELIYFITAYDRSSTYGAQTNIILWQRENI